MIHSILIMEKRCFKWKVVKPFESLKYFPEKLQSKFTAESRLMMPVNVIFIKIFVFLHLLRVHSCLDDTRLPDCFYCFYPFSLPLKLPLMTFLRSFLQFRNNWCRQLLSNYHVEIDAHRIKCAREYGMWLSVKLHSHLYILCDLKDWRSQKVESIDIFGSSYSGPFSYSMESELLRARTVTIVEKTWKKRKVTSNETKKHNMLGYTAQQYISIV